MTTLRRLSIGRPRVALLVVTVLMVLGGAGALLFIVSSNGASGRRMVRYGITPYQDSALPVVAQRLGWYDNERIEFVPVPAAWGDIVAALASGSIDVAIYNFNSFQPPYENASQGARTPVFYCPLYIFKGQAIMVRADGSFALMHEEPGEDVESRRARVGKIATQLRGKRIGITEGTELEQIVRSAMIAGGLDPDRDATLVHASPEDTLAAFLAGNLDAFAAGLTERVEASRHGAGELLTMADVALPVIDGLVTTEAFARDHQQLLDDLCQLWFKTIVYMEEDLTNNSAHIREYLASAASTRYSANEYQMAWTFNIFPKSAADAERLFGSEVSPYFWRQSWDENNKFLIQESKIKRPVPYSAYLGEATLRRLAGGSN